jgi:Domain of unknown function (DUF3850)
MYVHEVKCWPEFYGRLLAERKTAELRRDDRDPRYEVGDLLWEREWSPDGGYTGNSHFQWITDVFRDDPLIPPGYCLLSVRRVKFEGGR